MNRPQFERGREGKEGSRSFPEWNCRLNFLSSKKKSVDDLVVSVFVSTLFVDVFCRRRPKFWWIGFNAEDASMTLLLLASTLNDRWLGAEPIVCQLRGAEVYLYWPHRSWMSMIGQAYSLLIWAFFAHRQHIWHLFKKSFNRDHLLLSRNKTF